MKVLENGAIIGDYKKELYEEIAPGIMALTASGEHLTIRFVKILPQRLGKYAPTPKSHFHVDYEHTTVLIEGRATLILEGKRIPVKRGSHWFAPPGVEHGLDLRETEGEILLLMIYPQKDCPAFPADMI